MWAEFDEIECPCLGDGWADITPDNWEECPIHFHGQLHPQSRLLLLDNPKLLAEEEKRAALNFNIRQAHENIASLKEQLRREEERLVKLELELVNKTPTLRVFPAIKLEDTPNKMESA